MDERVLPQEFHRSLLAEGHRADGRELYELRKMAVEPARFLNARGGSSVRTDDGGIYFATTSVEIGLAKRCRRRRALSPPSRESSFVADENVDDDEGGGALLGGTIEVAVRFASVCGADFEQSSASGHQNVPHLLAERLSSLLNCVDVVDLEKLKIGERHAWVIRVSVTCVQYTGCAFEMTLNAAVAALMKTRLPRLKWDVDARWWREERQADVAIAIGKTSAEKMLIEAADGGVEDIVVEGGMVTMQRLPRAATFAKMFQKHWVADPTKEEEAFGHVVTFCRVPRGSSNASSGDDDDRWHVVALGGVPLGDAFELKSLRSAAVTSTERRGALLAALAANHQDDDDGHSVDDEECGLRVGQRNVNRTTLQS